MNFIISSINRKSIISFQNTFIAFWSVNEEFMKQMYHHVNSIKVDSVLQIGVSTMYVSNQMLQQAISYSTHVAGQ